MGLLSVIVSGLYKSCWFCGSELLKIDTKKLTKVTYILWYYAFKQKIINSKLMLICRLSTESLLLHTQQKLTFKYFSDIPIFTCG